MNTNNKHPHFSRTVLHNGEERVKRIFRDQLAELAGLLEVGISLLVVVALMLAVVPLIKMLPGLLVDTNEVEISLFLQRALDIVIGIEFIKMLDMVVPGFAANETLLYSPELKFYSNKVKMDSNLDTNIKGLHCLGDSSGWTRGLMMASVMGVLMGRKLAEKEGC